MNFMKMAVCYVTIALAMIGMCATAASVELSISGQVIDSESYSFAVSGEFPEETKALMVYSEPDNSLFCTLVSMKADSELFMAIMKNNPMFSTMIDMTECEMNAHIPYSPGENKGFSLHTAKLENGVLTQTHLATVYTNTIESFEFYLETDSLGCYTWGRCNGGQWFRGPQCYPCLYTVCCIGTTGWIQCDLDALCP